MASRRVWYVVAMVGLLGAGALVVLWYGLFRRDDGAGVPPEDPQVAEILEAYQTGEVYPPLEIVYPLDGAVFPPGIVAPMFRWKDEHAGADTWLVTIEFPDGKPRMNALSRAVQWTHSPQQWERIQARSLEGEAKVTVVGINQAAPKKILSAASITISTSKDEVGAPLFYREVNLPFIDAVKDPTRIRWRFGEISSQQPPIVLEELPVCGNCHSFSADGAVLGMDVDYANDKGSYAIVPVAAETTLSQDNIITWSDYKREDGNPTYGLLSQISPDGRYIVSTVKDRSVFVPRPGLEFSQLFFPIRGILAVHCRETGEFFALPGADDPRFVQSNPTWSPDGKNIVFARSKAHRLKGAGSKVLLTEEECREFLQGGKTFLFDLYRIPFNDGKGGEAEPLQGASNNGMSNFFPKYSPDGKWIVFCRAKSFMLLQPDSQLYVIPAAGGEARRMRCNTARMNSWHSWSPNGRWLVFSSKANGPFTQLWLSHIDRQCGSSPPVLLSHFTAPDRAANIPEFVNVPAGAIQRIRQQFVDAHSLVRAAHEYVVAGDLAGAAGLYRRALKLDPESAEAHDCLGDVLLSQGMFEEAGIHFARAIRHDPKYASAHINLGLVLHNRGSLHEAIEHFNNAVQLNPKLPGAHDNWGNALADLGQFDEAIKHYQKALEIDPQFDSSHYNWGNVLMRLGKIGQAIEHYTRAVDINPKNSLAHGSWGNALADLGQFDEAIKHYQIALEINPQCGASHYNLGNVLMKLRKLGQAVEHFSKAVEINPQDALAHDTLGLALAQQGRLDQAIALWKKALALDPNRTQTRTNLGNALVARGYFKEAITQFQKALEADSNNVRAINDLAWLLATAPEDDIRDGTRAVRLAEQVCKATGHKIAAPLDTLAAAYAEAGRFPEAVNTATKAWELARRQQESLAENIARRLELYQAGKPYRQQP